MAISYTVSGSDSTCCYTENRVAPSTYGIKDLVKDKVHKMYTTFFWPQFIAMTCIYMYLQWYYASKFPVISV